MVMFLPSGWCFCLTGWWFNHIVVDGITTLITDAPEMCHWCLLCFGWCYCQDGWCYCHLEVIGRCYCHVADVIATVCLISCLMLLPCGWCYCHFVVMLADVIACRLMELSTVGMGGRWNSHWVNALVVI